MNVLLFVAEAGNCNAGIGYNGLDEQGQPKWDLMSNAKVRNVEVRQDVGINPLYFFPT